MNSLAIRSREVTTTDAEDKANCAAALRRLTDEQLLGVVYAADHLGYDDLLSMASQEALYRLDMLNLRNQPSDAERDEIESVAQQQAEAEMIDNDWDGLS